MKRTIPYLSAAIAIAAGLAIAAPAQATSSRMSQFRTAYPAAVGSRIDTCSLCHTSAPAFNPYGSAYDGANASFTAIASADSDGDGYSNSAEITALTFPGNAADRPTTPVADTTLPTLTAFAIPATSTTLNVAITTLTASDNVGVTGYLVSESATKPAAGAAGWAATRPASYTFATAGAHTLYAYAKDAAGNVSNSRSASVTITLPDTTLPTVSAFAIPATSTTLNVAITTLTASDNVAVTGYFVSESATKPAAGAAGWTASAPTSFTFPAAGARTLYAYAKDAAGNVSNSRSASVTITLPPAPDTTLPTVSAFAIPATSTTLNVAITTLTASDNVGVTGYLVSESATKPAAGAAGWTASAPTSFTFGTAGAHTLYAYAKDAAGNVSNSRSASVTITLPPAPDTTLPTVSAFAIPATSTTLNVAITTLTASDNVGVTGYFVSESATKPAAGAAGWTASAPTSFTFATAGAHTLYAYAKDAAGNVSNSRSASVTITLPPPPPVADTTAPSVVAFSLPISSVSLTVAISGLSASDNVGVTGYFVSESSAKPAAGAAGWTASAPSSYTFPAAGVRTLYAFAKDAAGNVSSGRSASVTITLEVPPPPPPPPPTDPPESGVLFSDTFSDANRYGDPNWQTLSGKFAGAKGKFSALGRRANLALVQQEAALDPYLGGRIETDLQVLDDGSTAAAGVVFDYQSAQRYRFVLLSKNGTVTVGEVSAVSDEEDDDDDAAEVRVQTSSKRVRLRRTAGGWHHLSVEIDSATGAVRVYLDQATQPAVSKAVSYFGGRVGIMSRSKAAFDNFQVQSPTTTP